MTGARMGGLAAELRRAFDRSFAEEPRGDVSGHEDLLAVRVAGEPLAMRLAELSGLAAGRKTTPLPTDLPGLLGISSFRGTLVPTYDLRVLFGHPDTGEPRWLALVGKNDPIGLAFDHLDGYLRVPPEAMTREREDQAQAFIQQIVKADGLVRPVVHLPSVVEAIRQRVRQMAQRKET